MNDPDPALSAIGDNPDDSSPSQAGLTPIALVQAATIDPDALTTGALLTNDAVPSSGVGPGVPSVLWSWNLGNEIAAGATSSVLFLTSNESPTFVWAETESAGGEGSAGDVVGVSVPEPATALLLGAGLLGLGALRRKRAT